MNRKEFITGILTLGLGLKRARPFSGRRRWGLVQANDPLSLYVKTVWLNGQDVTDYCCAAHDGEGWVDLYPVDGDRVIIGIGPRRFYGDVVIEVKKDG